MAICCCQMLSYGLTLGINEQSSYPCDELPANTGIGIYGFVDVSH